MPLLWNQLTSIKIIKAYKKDKTSYSKLYVLFLGFNATYYADNQIGDFKICLLRAA